MVKIKMKTSRGELSAPQKVYSDKKTMVEIRIHKSRAWAGLEDSNQGVSGAFSAKRCLKNQHEQILLSKERKEKDGQSKDIAEMLEGLKVIATISGVNNVKDYDIVSDFTVEDVVRSSSVVMLGPHLSCRHLEGKVKILESESLKLKDEAARCNLDNEEMVKQMKVGKDDVDRLEGQIFDLKTIISKLSKTNGELLGLVSDQLHQLDLVASLENEGTMLADQVRREKSHSSDLQQRVLSADAEVAVLREMAADGPDNFRQSFPDCELRKEASRESKPSSLPASYASRPSFSFSPEACSSKKSSSPEVFSFRPLHSGALRKQLPNLLPHLSELRSTTLADAPSYQENLMLGLDHVFQPLPVEVEETSSATETVMDHVEDSDGFKDSPFIMQECLQYTTTESGDDLDNHGFLSRLGIRLPNNPLPSPDNDLDKTSTTATSLNEVVFLLGLEDSIVITEYQTE